MPDVDDVNPFDNTVCSDTDADGCDDCSSGVFNTSNDGPDDDGDGICNLSYRGKNVYIVQSSYNESEIRL